MLYEQYEKGTDQVRVTREKLKEWYDGYHTAGGKNGEVSIPNRELMNSLAGMMKRRQSSAVK